MIKAGHPFVLELIEQAEAAGIQFSGVTNPMSLDTGIIASDVRRASAFVGEHIGELAGEATRVILGLPSANTDFMFESYYNTVKIWSVFKFSEAARLKHEAEVEARAKQAEKEGKEPPVEKPFSFHDAVSPFADTINQEIGGKNWHKYTFMNPTTQMVLNLMMFSPMWTASAWTAAGGAALTGMLFKDSLTPAEANFIFTKRWPRMALYVMTLTPAIVQGLAYAVGLAMGTVTPDDEWLMFKNEKGRKLHADLSPLLRGMPWYKGEPTGKKRSYIRWGKQAYETQRWIESPVNSLMSKSSQMVRWAIEQATGYTSGSMNYPAPFKGQGLKGLLLDREDKFMGSRLGYTVQKFMPFSLLAWAQNPDAAPFQVIGPVSGGMSYYRATEAMRGLMDTWARDTTYANVYRNKRIKANLEALAPDILRAAEINGYDPDKVITAAKGAVLKGFYASLFKAINAGDTYD